MRKLLISLAVLSAVETLFMIMMIVGFEMYTNSKYDVYSYWNGSYTVYDAFYDHNWLAVGYAFSAVFGITWIPQLVIGIIVIVLAARGMPNNKALAITSGVLGILGGVFFVNAIVAGISSHKEKSIMISSNRSNYNQQMPIRNNNMSEVEKLKAEIEAIKAEKEIEKLRNEVELLRKSKTK